MKRWISLVVVLAMTSAVSAQTKAPKNSQPPGESHEAKRPAATGYDAKKPVSRFELAYALYKYIQFSDAALKQPLSGAETKGVKPLPPLAVTPIKTVYTDLPKSHWAAGAVMGLQAQGISLVSGTTFGGDKSITPAELTAALEQFAARVEHRKAGVGTLSALVSGGYLPKDIPLAGSKTVSAQIVSGAIAKVLSHAREKLVPISPDSEHAPGN